MWLETRCGQGVKSPRQANLLVPWVSGGLLISVCECILNFLLKINSKDAVVSFMVLSVWLSDVIDDHLLLGYVRFSECFSELCSVETNSVLSK